jgi:hypothetical protein
VLGREGAVEQDWQASVTDQFRAVVPVHCAVANTGAAPAGGGVQHNSRLLARGLKRFAVMHKLLCE